MFQRHSLPRPRGRYFLSLFSLAILWTLLYWGKWSALLIIPGTQFLSSGHSYEMRKVIVSSVCGQGWTSCTWRDVIGDKPHTLPFSLLHITVYWELWLPRELSLLSIRDFSPEIICLFTVYLTSDFQFAVWYTLRCLHLVFSPCNCLHVQHRKLDLGCLWDCESCLW